MEFNTTREMLSYIKARLSSNGEQERDSIAFLLIDELTGYDQNKILLNSPVSLPKDKLDELSRYISELNKHKPVQYVLGKAHFYGRDFIVDKNTLIPRMETEELVQLVRDKAQKIKNPQIIDIGTGSGCIAISIALEVPGATLSAIDISSEAITVASKNAEKHNAVIDFSVEDIFSYSTTREFDIIVSNPPYVLDNEKLLMKENVLAYEPKIALFVPNDNPLLYYKRIAEFSALALKRGGYICLEINEQFGAETAEVLLNLNFMEVSIIKDINSKDRFVVGSKKH